MTRMQMHRCAEGKCDREIPAGMLACREHWAQLPPQLRGEITAAWRDGGEQPTGRYIDLVAQALERWTIVNATLAELAGPTAQRFKCRSCLREIVFAKTDNDRTIPLDANPASAVYNIVIEPLGVRAVKVESAERIHVPHFASCPNVSAWRGRGAPLTVPA